MIGSPRITGFRRKPSGRPKGAEGGLKNETKWIGRNLYRFRRRNRQSAAAPVRRAGRFRDTGRALVLFHSRTFRCELTPRLSPSAGRHLRRRRTALLQISVVFCISLAMQGCRPAATRRGGPKLLPAAQFRPPLAANRFYSLYTWIITPRHIMPFWLIRTIREIMRNKVDIQIGSNVKAMRKKLNISQRTLGEIIGTDHSFIYQVEKETSLAKYSAYHLYMIAKYFGCSVSDLYPPIDPLEP